jgi:hypothetical protein
MRRNEQKRWKQQREADFKQEVAEVVDGMCN